MATNAESRFSKSKNIRDLDDSLKRSFTHIKGDMGTIKENLHQQGVKLAEVKQNIKDHRSDFVTLDKFNILKIRIGELNENMKKVWDIEKKLEDLDRKSVSASEFDKQSVETNNEVAKLKQDFTGLSDSATTTVQTKNLVDDINDEFDNIKQSIEQLRSIKDAITKEEVDKKVNSAKKKVLEVRDEFDKFKAQLKTKANMSQVEALINDINSEFDKVKESLAKSKESEGNFALDADVKNQIAKLSRRIAVVSQEVAIAVDTFSKGVETSLKDLSKANEKSHDALSLETERTSDRLTKKLVETKATLTGQIASIRDDMKSLVSKKQAQKLVDDLNKEFDGVKDHLDSNVKDVALLKKDSATRKELTEGLNKIQDTLKEISEDDIGQNSKDISSLKKSTATKKEIQAEMNKLRLEISSVAKEMALLRKEAATRDETAEAFDDVEERLKENDQALKIRFDALAKMMSDDSDSAQKSARSNSQDISTIAKTFKKTLKGFVRSKALDDEIDVINDEFERLHKEISTIQDNMLEQSDLKSVNSRLQNHVSDSKKGFVNKSQFEKLSSVVERLQDQLDIQGELIVEKRKELRAYAKDLKTAKKAEKKLSKYESSIARSEAKAEKRARKEAEKAKKAKEKAKAAGTTNKKSTKSDAEPFRKSKFLSAFLIAISFVILIAAIVFFFSGMTGLTDTLAVAAVICFVLGIVTRIVVGFQQE
ncbi:MAG: hypothetical protein V1729_02010 [Candidatus Woesearchaeota archaeon]